MGIFQDPRANALFAPNMGTQFESPAESMYMGAGWSQDQAYMSPAYMGNYRPQYGGDVGFSPNNIPEFSTMGAFNASIPTPFQNQSPFYIDPLAYRDTALTQASTGFADAAMWGVQNIAAPLGAFAAASKFTSMKMPTGTPMTGGQRFAGSVGAQLGRAPGMAAAAYRTNVTGTMSQGAYTRYAGQSARAAATRAGTQSIGAFAGGQSGRLFGAGLGRMAGGIGGGVLGGAGRMFGVGKGIGATAAAGSAMMGAGLGAGLGAMGAAAGTLAAPFMVASAGLDAAQYGLFDPYIASRRGQQAATANFGSQYTGTSPYGTTGISRRKTAEVSQALVDAGTEERAFGLEGGINIFDQAMSSGLMENMGNLDPDDIKKKVKNISKQVQALMAVAGDPDVGRAIQKLAEMKRMGISGGDAQATIQALGAAEAITGTSSAQIQGTVGKQSSYLFQQAGISGQGAQAAAATSYAGFSNAYKMGLIGDKQMALMGGAEGATQSLMTGQIGLARSMYNQIGLTNRFMGGGEGDGVLSNLSNFGKLSTQNPLAMMGAMRMNSAAMTGAQLDENPLAPTDSIFDMMEMLPDSMTKGADGKTKWSAFAGAALQMGVGEDQLRALLEQKRALQAPGASGRMTAASVAAFRGQRASQLETMGLDYTQGEGALSDLAMGAHKIGVTGSKLQGAVSGSINDVNAVAGRMVDIAGRAMFGDALTGGGSSQTTKGDVAEFFKTGKSTLRQVDITNPNAGFLASIDGSEEIIERVEERINKGGASKEQLDKVMASTSHSGKVRGLRDQFGLSTADAEAYIRMKPVAEMNTKETEANFGRAIDSIAGHLRAGKNRNKDAKRLRKEGAGISGSMSTKEQMQFMAVMGDIAGDPSMLSDIFTEGEEFDTKANRAKRAVLSKAFGRKVTAEDVKTIRENAHQMEQQVGKHVVGASDDPMVRAAMMDEELRRDPSIADDPKKFEALKQRIADRVNATGGATTKSATVTELEGVAQVEAATAQNQARLQKMLQGGQLDFTGYMEADSATVLSGAAKTFELAVTTFARAVEADTGEQVYGMSAVEEKDN